MARRKFQNGMVVWAVVPDRSGNTKPQPRPLLITSVHPTEKKAPFVAHCISTRKDNTDADPVVEMPWNAETGAGVGLYCWCALVLRWSVIIDMKDVQDISGKVSDAFFELVKKRISELL